METEKKEEELTEDTQDEDVATHGLLVDDIKTPSSEVKVQPQKDLPKKEEPIDDVVKKALAEQYAQLNKRLTALGQENKKLKDRLLQPPSGEDTVLESMLQDKRKQVASSGEVDPMIPMLEAQLADRKRQAQLRKQQQIVDDNWDKISEQINNAGLNPDDEALEPVMDAFEDARDFSGNFDKVFRKLNKAIANRKAPEQVKPEAEKPRQTEEERINALVEERLRKRMEDKGLLISDNGQPSAMSGSFQDFEKRYIEGKVSRDQYEERARKEGKLL